MPKSTHYRLPTTNSAVISKAQIEHHAANEALARSEADLASLRTELALEKKQLQEKVALLDTARGALSDHFQSLANEILEKKGERFSELNRQTLGQLLDPLKTQIKSFQDKAESIQLSDTERQTLLRTELAQMKQLNLRMTEEAHALATVLRGEAKVRGNWGRWSSRTPWSGPGCERERTINGGERTDGRRAPPSGCHHLPSAESSPRNRFEGVTKRVHQI